MEKTLQGETGGQAADAGKRILRGEFSAGIRIAVSHDDILEGDGVKRAEGNVSYADVPVDVVRYLVDHPSDEIRLYRRRLDGHDESEQHDQQCRQDPKRYAEALFHQSTNLT